MTRTKSALYFALSSIAISAAGPAMAQTTTGQGAGVQSDEIVVTARKTEESLLESPIAVSVISGDFLDQTGFNTIGDIVRFVPGFDLTPINTSRATGAKIRGISTFSFSDGFESSVATVIDGVSLGREAQGFFDLFDVESIEVIKGPQGTLFGKNASAGVVNIRTRKPDFEFRGGFDASYGSFNEVALRGTITGPLAGDVLAGRLSGTYNSHDGMLDNAIPGESDVNDKNTYSLRGQLLFTPSEALSARLIMDYVQEENHCCLPTFRTAGPTAVALLFATNPGVQQLRPGLAALGITPGPGNRTVAVRYDNILQKSESSGVALNVDYDIAKGATLTSITSYRDWEINEFNEADGISTSNVNDRNGTAASTDQFSQELRLDQTFGERFSYVAGLYYFHQNLDAQGQVDIQLALPFPPFFNVRTNADRTVETESAAVFGEATFGLTDKLSLIVGGRYTDDTIDATYRRVASPIIATRPFGAFFGADVTGAQKVTEQNVSGRVIGRYFWTDNFMTYATWSRGYKGPGIDVAESVNVAAIATPGGLPVLKPEIPTLVEVGFRSVMLDDTLSANVTLFHEDVEGLQTISTNAVGATLNLSIDKINSVGLEADVVFAPKAVEGLTLTGGFNFNEVDIVKFAGNPALQGRRFRDSARYSYSIVGDYSRPISGSGFEGFARAEWSWQSGKLTSLAGDPTTLIEPYGLLNLRAGVRGPGERYSLTFSVENVTDEDYAHFIFGSSYNALDGTTRSQFLGDPRTGKITLRANF